MTLFGIGFNSLLEVDRGLLVIVFGLVEKEIYCLRNLQSLLLLPQKGEGSKEEIEKIPTILQNGALFLFFVFLKGINWCFVNFVYGFVLSIHLPSSVVSIVNISHNPLNPFVNIYIYLTMARLKL